MPKSTASPIQTADQTAETGQRLGLSGGSGELQEGSIVRCKHGQVDILEVAGAEHGSGEDVVGQDRSQQDVEVHWQYGERPEDH